MRRFHVRSASGTITGEGVAFQGDENAVRWLKSDSLTTLAVGRVYRVTTSELDEILAELRMRLYWLDGTEPPEQKGSALT
jgi:hypothetical protein